MILAQIFLYRHFTDKIALLYQMPKSEKGYNSAKHLQDFVKS